MSSTIAAISGFAQENMNRGAGWRVFDTGRRIERGVNTCRFARHFASGDAPADDLSLDGALTEVRKLEDVPAHAASMTWRSAAAMRACPGK